MAARIGNPIINKYKEEHFDKLLEDPTSLNLFRGLSAMSLVKNEIRRCLFDTQNDIKYNIIRQSLHYTSVTIDSFTAYLLKITPCFPRFLSEFKSGTYLGITEALIGLFQNSRTIRKLMEKRFKAKVDSIIYKSECISIERLLAFAKQAVRLRTQSWGRSLVGTTVPHPSELIGRCEMKSIYCQPCLSPTCEARHITVTAFEGMCDFLNVRGI